MQYLKALTICIVLLLITLLLPSNTARAGRIDDLKDQIDVKGVQINEIEKDIKKYQQELTVIGAEKRTLQTAVNELDTSQKKLSADIGVTEVRIDRAVFSIEKLNLEIEEQERRINLNSDAIAGTIRGIHEAESQSLVEQILGYENISEYWSQADNLSQFQVALTGDLHQLYNLKKELEGAQSELRGERDDLGAYKQDLSGKKAVVDANKTEKSTLLTRTKSEESSYQTLLAERIRLRDAFLAEIQAIEDQIRIEIDPSSIPSTGSGILKWPLDNIVITQYFGNTSFATANPQIYKGSGHNGVDFGIARGSRVKTALAGTVKGSGNTDAVAGCYSYGKWVLVEHNNGLSTLYAHLDVINVSAGELVGTGDTIGYSGNTGYSTGPHLHFTVYASSGVQITKFTSSINCKNASIPIAPRDAYLNPLSYL